MLFCSLMLLPSLQYIRHFAAGAAVAPDAECINDDEPDGECKRRFGWSKNHVVNEAVAVAVAWERDGIQHQSLCARPLCMVST